VLKVSNDTKHVQNPKNNQNILTAKNNQSNIKKRFASIINVLKNTNLNEVIVNLTIFIKIFITILNNHLSIKKQNKASHSANEKSGVVLICNVNDVHFVFSCLGLSNKDDSCKGSIIKSKNKLSK